ncbi:MAG: cytochrome P450 [Minicystis sp.]
MSRSPVIPFNPFAPPSLDDPYPALEEARRQASVFFNPVLEMWMVTRYADVISVVRDPRRFASHDTVRYPHDLSPRTRALLATGYEEMSILVNDDPPFHTRMRGLVGNAFLPERIRALEPRIRAITTELLDRLAGEREADLVARLAWPLPVRVIGAMSGVPEDDMTKVKAWSDDWMLLCLGRIPEEQQLAHAEGVLAFQRYTTALVEARRREPQDDITTSLVQARFEGGELSTPEIAVFMMGLLLAGHETTTNLIANTLLHLLRAPAILDEVRRDASLIPAAIEETLRFDPPIQGMIRTVRAPATVGGVELPEGARMFLSYAAANRDEAEFTEPDRWNPRRAASERHLGFGHGIHFCIGAPLARLEARVALEQILARLPDVRLAPDHTIAYVPNLLHRGPRSLRVAWG